MNEFKGRQSRKARTAALLQKIGAGPQWRYWGPNLPRVESEMVDATRSQYFRWLDEEVMPELRALLEAAKPKPQRAPAKPSSRRAAPARSARSSP